MSYIKMQLLILIRTLNKQLRKRLNFIKKTVIKLNKIEFKNLLILPIYFILDIDLLHNFLIPPNLDFRVM